MVMGCARCRVIPSMEMVRDAVGLGLGDMVFRAGDWIEWAERNSWANGSIGVGRGSNAVPAHFTLTFAALDRILPTFEGCESEADAPCAGYLDDIRKPLLEKAATKERHDE